MTARGECVLIWGGFTLSGKGGSQGGSQKGGGSQGVREKGGSQKGGSREPYEPPLATDRCVFIYVISIKKAINRE